ncbi:uncharacterized protein LOC143335308 isoform X2 [Chaetodon auriga]
MVRHVIGRKHRQKYVELKRPDLVTWDKQSIISQGGKIIRARAEIVERQDGRGSPLLMPKKGKTGKLNMSAVPPTRRQDRGRGIFQSLTQPQLKGNQDEYSHQGWYPPGHSGTTQFHTEDPYMMNRDRQLHQQEDAGSNDRMQEELQRADYRESDMYMPENMHPDCPREYDAEYVEDPQRRAVLEPGGGPMYDSRVEVPRGQAQHVEYYSEETPPDRRPYPERDLLKEFYSEEVRRGRVRSAEYQPSQPVYPEGNNRRWSMDRESGRHDGMNRAGRQGSSEPEAKRRSFAAPAESDWMRDRLFNMNSDYCPETSQPHQEDAVVNSGPSRTGPLNPQRQVEATRSMSDIPEPFRRFLKGATKDEGQLKRKRKSRFSDAMAEEVEKAKEMFRDEYGPPNPKFDCRPRPVHAPLRPEIHGSQHPVLYTESQGPHHTESYQRGGSESAGVFDVLKNIEIENAEEADFLKNKLCDLLKEFRSKKLEKAGQNSHGRAVISKDYNSLKPDSELPPRHQYETALREDSDLRQPEDLNFKEDHRGRGWKQREHTPDERLHPVRGEPRHPNTNRSRYEEVFGLPEMSLMPRATHPDEPARYPERFQETMQPRKYQPAAGEFLDSHSPAPPLHVGRGQRIDRGPRYSNNLDKITSTLLELVARK